MIAWLLKKVANRAAQKPAQSTRTISPENCALWHDVSRALDAKPRASK
ncbi:MAG: hypothetical protein JWQ22_3243 [Devosia sp.]|nr:hypothetical protein [Devosia sp.]